MLLFWIVQAWGGITLEAWKAGRGFTLLQNVQAKPTDSALPTPVASTHLAPAGDSMMLDIDANSGKEKRCGGGSGGGRERCGEAKQAQVAVAGAGENGSACRAGRGRIVQRKKGVAVSVGLAIQFLSTVKSIASNLHVLPPSPLNARCCAGRLAKLPGA